MSQYIVLYHINKFIETYDEENNDDTGFPFKDMFTKIKDDLKLIHNVIFNKFFALEQEIIDSMRESVYALDELLIQCLTVGKKRKGSAKICLNYYSPADLLFLVKTREKLQKIMQDIHEIRGKAESVLGPSSHGKDEPDSSSTDQKVKWTSGDVDEIKIFGWEKRTKEIAKFLIKENKEGLNVVGIVGMFGTGKTTLAQKVFVDDDVMDNFSIRLWVWVSANCDKEVLLRRTLENLGVEEDYIDDALKIDSKLERVGVLLFLLHLELVNKRYLIVFDDVVNIKAWHCELDKAPPEEKQWSARLAFGLPKGDGSAIIITSRKEDDTRKMVGSGAIYTPEPLLGKDGWALFKSSYEEEAKEAFNDSILEGLRDEITHKCDGLPIALKAAGKNMAREKQQKENEAIRAEISSLPNQQETGAEGSSLKSQQATVPEAPTLPNKQEQATAPESPTHTNKQEQATAPESPTHPNQEEQATDPESPTHPNQEEQATDPESPTHPNQQEQATAPEAPKAPTLPNQQEQATDTKASNLPNQQEQATGPEAPTVPNKQATGIEDSGLPNNQV